MLRSLKQEISGEDFMSCVSMVSGGKETKAREKKGDLFLTVSTLHLKKPHRSLLKKVDGIFKSY